MNSRYFNSSHRCFLTRAGLLTAAELMELPARAIAKTPRLFTGIGTNDDPAKAKVLDEQGSDFFTGETGPFLVPEMPQQDFATNLENLQDCPLPMPACNGFIQRPISAASAGKANHDQVLKWADTCFRRRDRGNQETRRRGSGGKKLKY